MPDLKEMKYQLEEGELDERINEIERGLNINYKEEEEMENKIRQRAEKIKRGNS